MSQKPPPSDKNQALSKALRANLAKRKAQGRAQTIDQTGKQTQTTPNAPEKDPLSQD